MARSRSATPSRPGGGFLLGMAAGLVLGLAIALGVAFYLNRTPIPFVANKTKDTPKDAKAPAIAGMPQGTAATGTPEKPKFDFYKILPGTEETVSDKELKARAAAAAKGQQDASKDVYFIQAGSFQNPADADNQKARLAILGFESSVEPASLPDKGTWYRVRMGPYRKVEEINRVRQLLAQNNIDASLFKVKEQ
jgi:cell division protein FtsN